jgi:branched-chain amino acid transport system substrate-binding protein
MYVVRVTGGAFKIVGDVSGEEAIGPDECKRF